MKSYAELFRHSGASYHAAMVQYPRVRDAEFMAVTDLLPKDRSLQLLDVPAGGGYLRGYLPPKIQYTGLDFSGGFEQGESGIGVCTESNLGVPPASFDYVVCMASLHHVVERTAFFAACYDTLHAGGKLIIADVIAGSKPAQFLNGFVDQNNSLGHEGDFIQSNRELNELSSIGFSVSEETANYHWVFTNLTAAKEYFRLLFSLDKNPSDHGLEAAIQSLGCEEKGGKFKVNWQLGVMVAGKT
ncbi:MAG: methyltransferase domain-containing protein [Pseudomonadota bacterium]